MSPIVTIQEPITGAEAAGSGQAPHDALVQFYRAFNGRGLALMERCWDSCDDVAMDNPLGGIRRGWLEIRTTYERIFAGPARVHVEFHDYTVHALGDVFFAVGRERGWFEKGGTRLDLAIRTTRIFRRREGRWRQVHHHGSIETPALLAAYQAAVR
jgi:ketosteroid isomerase-like protein